MKLLILDANLFVRFISRLKYYLKLVDLVLQGKVKIIIHDAIFAETLSVLLKSKESKLFGKVDKERIMLNQKVREEVWEDLESVIKFLNVEVIAVGKEDMDKALEKVKDVCISAFDALTLVVADKVKPDLIATDDKLFKNRALEKGYKIQRKNSTKN